MTCGTRETLPGTQLSDVTGEAWEAEDLRGEEAARAGAGGDIRRERIEEEDVETGMHG